MSEYSEPWTTDDDGIRRTARPDGARPFVLTYDGGIMPSTILSDRIVAAVNACAGIPDDQLAGLRVDNLIRLAEVVAEKFEGTDSPLGYLARGALSKEPR